MSTANRYCAGLQFLAVLTICTTGPWAHGGEPQPSRVGDPRFTLVWPFSDGLAQVTTAHGAFFIDRSGQPKIDLDRLLSGKVAADSFKEGLAPIQPSPLDTNARWGFIDKRGKVVIKPRYCEVKGFTQGRAMVIVGDPCIQIDPGLVARLAGGRAPQPAPLKVPLAYQYIDRTGKVIFGGAQVHHLAPEYSEGLAWVRFVDAPHCGFVDLKGKLAFRFECVQMQGFRQGLASVSVARGRRAVWGFLDRQGKWAITPRFERAGWFAEGLAFVRDRGRVGYVDRSGRFVIKPRFREGWELSEGRARVRVGRRWGFIDRRGQLLIKPQFEDAWSFEEGLAMVKQGGKWGFVDPDGKWAVRPLFGTARPFSAGLAPVETSGNPGRERHGYVDKQGKWVLERLRE